MSTPGTAPVATLGGTRTSHRWATMPGNWDRLNTRAIYASTNEWGIPDLPVAGTAGTVAQLLAYTDRHRIRTTQPGDAVHFFLDDYRFEVMWSKPERGLSRCLTVGAALTPDFSMWTDMPLAMQLWQVYRSRWCGAWMLNHGIDVIPTVSWSTPDTYPFAFAGIARGSVVAVSTVGIVRADTDVRARFADGYAAMIEHIRPATVLVYGTEGGCSIVGDNGEVDGTGTPVRHYPARRRAD